jgi:DNA primase
MPAKYLDYYTRVADRIVPFVQGRHVAIEQRFPGTKDIVYRRHTSATGDDTWISIADEPALVDWARQYTEGLHAHIRSEDHGAWFVIDIDSRELSTNMALLAAKHAAEVLREQGIDPLVKFSGSDGYHLMWDVPNLDGIDDQELWKLERAVVRAVACEVERRLSDDPAAAPIRKAVGKDRPHITTANADRENPNALLFDEYILKDNANFRVPYSIHPRTGLVNVPLTRNRLTTFRPEHASPETVAKDWPIVALPQYSLEDVRSALRVWRENGC